jgi:hypothetical protein
MDRAADAVARIESVRVQLEALGRAVSDAEVRRAAQALGAKLVEVEMNLVDLRLTGNGQDGVRFGSKLIGKLGYLANGLGNGDFRPTDQQVEVQGILAQQLREHLTQLDVILGTDLPALNALLRQKGVEPVGGAPAIVP